METVTSEIRPITRESLRQRLKSKQTGLGLALSYAISTTLAVSGAWWPELLALAALCHVLAAHIQSARPKMLVLRRFGNAHVEVFLSQLVAGLSTFAQPIWLYDARAKPMIRKHLPSPVLYLMRAMVWLVLGYCIIGRVPGRAVAESLWIGWIILGTSLYHRYKAGHSPTAWISSVCALVGYNLLFSPLPGGATWRDGLVAMGEFIVLWAITSLLIKKTSLHRLFNRLSGPSTLTLATGLDRYVRELRRMVLFPRFIPIAPVQVAEIICAQGVWGTAVYHGINASSVVIADITDLEDNALMVWELQHARSAGAPIFFTCERRDVERACEVLRRLWGIQCSAFTWTRDLSCTDTVTFEGEKVMDSFFELIELHMQQELRYLPIAPSLAEALADLEKFTNHTKS